MTALPNFSQGNFVPEQIDLPKDQDELYASLKETLETHAVTINRKETGQHETVEVMTGQTFPGTSPQSKRYIFSKLINLGTLSTGANAIAHGISTGGAGSTFVFTHAYGTVYNQATPLWVQIPNDTILVTVDATNVNVTIPAAYNNYSAQIVLEFFKA